LANPDTYYEGGCNGLCGAGKVKTLITESVAALDAGVDFGAYDNDGPDGVPNSGDDDGYVDFVAFVHAEAGGECGGANVWSHRFSLSGWGVWNGVATDDARAGGGFVRIDDYVIQPALACGGVDMIEIGVFSHEFGHAFGLPDLYDTDGSSNGAGEWDLMASGSWGGNGYTPESPSHMSAWSKAFLGWVEPLEMDVSQAAAQVPDAETYAAALKVPFGAGVDADEYFLIENRRKIGFDASLRTGGLLIWHVDDDRWGGPGSSNNANTRECEDGPVNGPCADGMHYTLALEQADGRYDLEGDVNRSDSGDPFRAGLNDAFGADTTPWSRPYSGDAAASPEYG
ncbi:MAG: M6 family metalloprotease domain-containing protein, partial [Candidatus Methylomirabilis sp.]|nr:M6 family metalloprotease domain-containing protein [Deltaproteobacteria bacterium]